MSFGKVFLGNELIYQTSSVGCSLGSLHVGRLDESNRSRLASKGPNFDVKFFFSAFPQRERLKGHFEAQGSNTLGSVSFVSGAAARDGREAYDLTRVCARCEHGDQGFSASLNIELGEPHRESFCYEPKGRQNERYSIEAFVPFSDYIRFWNIRDRTVQAWMKGRIADVFGSAAAERIEVDA